MTTTRAFTFGHAIGIDPRELVNTCLSQIGDIPEEANLGFIYATDALATELEHILHLLKQATDITHWTGTLGIAICVTNHEIYDQPALAVMIGSFPEDTFLPLDNLTKSIDDFIQKQQQWIEANQPVFGVLQGDPTNPATPELVENLSDALNGGFFAGGLTSSQSLQLQVNGDIVTNGLSGVLFAPEVAVATDHTQGCVPIGPRRRVTRSDRNIIAELDNRPALQVLKEDVGEMLAHDLNRLGGFIFAGLPIKHSDTGDYMIRNLIGIDSERELLAIGEMIRPGDELMFCRRDGNAATEDMQRMLENLKTRTKGKKPRGGLYFSCLGRGRQQFGDDSEELKMITEVLGEFPLVGFFANGEIYHNRLYGFTGVLTLFL